MSERSKDVFAIRLRKAEELIALIWELEPLGVEFWSKWVTACDKWLKLRRATLWQ